MVNCRRKCRLNEKYRWPTAVPNDLWGASQFITFGNSNGKLFYPNHCTTNAMIGINIELTKERKQRLHFVIFTYSVEFRSRSSI